MDAKAKLRFQRGSARKARLVLDLIRGKSVSEARNILMFSEKRASEAILKLLNSAAANASNQETRVDADSMIITFATADDGPIMKRMRPRAQGRAFIIRKRTCHITLEISDAAGAEQE
jgi:large subunit ribosomal protein L22